MSAREAVLDLAVSFVVAEVEELVMQDRAAGVGAELVLVIGAVGECTRPVARLYLVVADKFEGFAVYLIRPALRDDVSLPAVIPNLSTITALEVLRPFIADFDTRTAGRRQKIG